MGGYWHDSPDNPFNQMSWTRGGGGYDNAQTRESNERRASAMPSGSVDALPRFANTQVAASIMSENGGGDAVVGDYIVRVGGGPASGKTATGPSGGGAGPGSQVVATGNPGAGPAAGEVRTPGPRTSGPGSGRVGMSFNGPETTPIFIGGSEMARDRGFSDAADAEDRWGEGEFLSPTWFYAWSVVGADMLEAVGLRKDRVMRDLSALPGKAASGVRDLAGFLDRGDLSLPGQHPDRYPFWEVNGSARVGQGGAVFKTGGGF